MISNFIEQKLKTAKYKILEDGTYFGEIPGISGVWSNAKKLEDCRNQLQEVFEEWLLISVRDHKTIKGLRMTKRVYA